MKAETYRIILYALLFFSAAGLVLFLYASGFIPCTAPGPEPEPSEAVPPEAYEPPSLEDAELTAFGFMQHLLKAVPPVSDPEAKRKMYYSLSGRARSKISMEKFNRDIALFIGIQDIPEYGVSVQDLKVTGEREASLIVGLNYSGGPVLRSVNMILENSRWRIDSVDILETYP